MLVEGNVQVDIVIGLKQACTEAKAYSGSISSMVPMKDARVGGEWWQHDCTVHTDKAKSINGVLFQCLGAGACSGDTSHNAACCS